MQVFFIVGAQKSGTTWLQKSLNSIDGIHCLGEGHFIDKLLMPMAQARHEYNQMMQVVQQRVYEGKGFYGPIPDQEFLRMMRSWILNIMVRNARAPEDAIVALGDKTPANSFHIPALKQLFPRSRFIHILRDGRDVAVSAFRHRERIQQETSQGQTTLDINAEAPQLLSKWAGFTKAVRRAESGGIPVHTVRYEAMLADPTAALHGCLQHIVPDHNWDQAMVQTAVDANSFRQTSGRDPGQASSTAFLRKGTAGGWRDELNPDALNRLAPEDQTLLNQLGYCD